MDKNYEIRTYISVILSQASHRFNSVLDLEIIALKLFQIKALVFLKPDLTTPCPSLRQLYIERYSDCKR